MRINFPDLWTLHCRAVNYSWKSKEYEQQISFESFALNLLNIACISYFKNRRKGLFRKSVIYFFGLQHFDISWQLRLSNYIQHSIALAIVQLLKEKYFWLSSAKLCWQFEKQNIKCFHCEIFSSGHNRLPGFLLLLAKSTKSLLLPAEI